MLFGRRRAGIKVLLYIVAFVCDSALQAVIHYVDISAGAVSVGYGVPAKCRRLPPSLGTGGPCCSLLEGLPADRMNRGVHSVPKLRRVCHANRGDCYRSTSWAFVSCGFDDNWMCACHQDGAKPATKQLERIEQIERIDFGTI